MEETVKIKVYLVTVGPNAIGVYESDEPTFGVAQPLIWLPLSELGNTDYIELFEGEVITIEIPEWLATEKGLV